MSPIGRVFLVLNLGLAGAFVAFAGTYLQRADDWRGKYKENVRTTTEEIKVLKTEKTSVKAELSEEKRQTGILTTQNDGLKNENSKAVADNEKLQVDLGKIRGDLNTNTATLGQIGSKLETAQKDAKDSMDRAIAAEKVKDEAETKMNDALKQLADANFKIKNQTTAYSEQGALLARSKQDGREKQVLLDLVNRRHPAIFETLHPLVTGTVSRVGASGNLVTITLQSGAENLKSGARFAIYNAADGYKGEATVSEVDGSKKFCFARLTLKNGKIAAGDNASTNLSASRSN